MDPSQAYSLLQEACIMLEGADEHAIAAHVGHAMALLQEKYGVGEDHLDVSDLDGEAADVQGG